MLHINLTSEPALKVLHFFVVLPPQLQAEMSFEQLLETCCAFPKKEKP